jgi:hypothetical protein
MKDRIFKMLEGITLPFILAHIAYHSGLLTFRSKDGWSQLGEIVFSIWREEIPADRIPEELQKIAELFMFHWSAITGVKIIVFLLLYVMLLTILRKLVRRFDWEWLLLILDCIILLFEAVKALVRMISKCCARLEHSITALGYGVIPAAYQNCTVSIIFQPEHTAYVWASARSEQKKPCCKLSRLPMLGTDGNGKLLKFAGRPRLWFAKNGKVFLTTCGKCIYDENGNSFSKISFDCGEARTVKIGSTELTIMTEEESK